MDLSPFMATGANNPAKQVSVDKWNSLLASVQIGGTNATFVTGIASGNSAATNSSAIQAAIDALFAAGGGTLLFPPGVYDHSGLTFKNKIQYRGAGRDTVSTNGTVLRYTGTGDGVVLVNPINSSTAANVSIEGITFKNVSRNAGKGCFADTGSSDLKFHRCAFIGSDRGLILDQSELIDVIECDFEGVASQTTLAWLVNGNDRNGTASPQFTNRISFQRCQFNGQTGTVLIVDDGGTDHSFVDNNYNGGANHFRVAGVNGLSFVRGEFESASAANVVMQSTSLAGAGVGSCGPVLFDRPIIVPGGTGNPCVTCFSGGQLTFIAPFFGNTTSAKVTGCANVNGIFSFGISNGGGGANFDGLATNHFQTDGLSGVVTNLSGLGTVPWGSSFTLQDLNGAGWEALLTRSAASPFRYLDLTSKAASGGWQGGLRVKLNYNGGALFDAFLVMANTDGTSTTNRMTGALQIPEVATGNVVTPPAGYQSLFLDSTDGKLKRMNSSRTVTIIN